MSSRTGMHWHGYHSSCATGNACGAACHRAVVLCRLGAVWACACRALPPPDVAVPACCYRRAGLLGPVFWLLARGRDTSCPPNTSCDSSAEDPREQLLQRRGCGVPLRNPWLLSRRVHAAPSVCLPPCVCPPRHEKRDLRRVRPLVACACAADRIAAVYWRPQNTPSAFLSRGSTHQWLCGAAFQAARVHAWPARATGGDPPCRQRV